MRPRAEIERIGDEFDAGAVLLFKPLNSAAHAWVLDAVVRGWCPPRENLFTGWLPLVGPDAIRQWLNEFVADEGEVFSNGELWASRELLEAWNREHGAS